MTDKEVMEFCDSRLKRLAVLQKARKELPKDEAGYKKWESIRDEVYTICDEVDEKLVEPDIHPEDVKVGLMVLELLDKSIKARKSYLPRR